MFKSLIVTKYTVVEAIKSKILINSVFFAIGLAVISYVASALTYGKTDKIVIDVGLGLISISLKLVAMFYGVGIIQDEVESRTLYLVLSKPLPRSHYFIGKSLGMIIVLAINTLLLAISLIFLFKFANGKVDEVIIWALVFSFFEAALLFLITIVSSLFCSKVLSVLFAITSYVAGYSSGELLKSDRFINSYYFDKLLKVANTVFPDFSRLNLKDIILYENIVTNDFLLSNVAYVVIYGIALIIVGIVIFEKKSFD